MVRADLTLYQPDSPAPLRIAPKPAPRNPLTDRLETARECFNQGDLTAAGVLCRTIIEQTLKNLLAAIKVKPMGRACDMLEQLATECVVVGMNRGLLAIGLTVGNLAAHADPDLRHEHVEALLGIARLAIDFDFKGPALAARALRKAQSKADQAAAIARKHAKLVAAAMQGGAA